MSSNDTSTTLSEHIKNGRLFLQVEDTDFVLRNTLREIEHQQRIANELETNLNKSNDSFVAAGGVEPKFRFFRREHRFRGEDTLHIIYELFGEYGAVHITISQYRSGQKDATSGAFHSMFRLPNFDVHKMNCDVIGTECWAYVLPSRPLTCRESDEEIKLKMMGYYFHYLEQSLKPEEHMGTEVEDEED